MNFTFTDVLGTRNFLKNGKMPSITKTSVLHLPVVGVGPVDVGRGEPSLEAAQRLLAGRESGLALDERLERLDVFVVGHLQVDGALVVGDVEVQHPGRERGLCYSFIRGIQICNDYDLD